MEKEKLDNYTIETTFQEIKKITGVSNIKQVVEKVANKDKDYNHSVAKANTRENQIKLIKERIRLLDEDFTDLKNTASIDVGESKKTAKALNYDRDAEDLAKKEENLKIELEEMREKNGNVELIYEKVIENLKSLTNNKNQEEISLDVSKNSNRSFNLEDDLVTSYNEFLTKTNNVADKTYAKVILFS